MTPIPQGIEVAHIQALVQAGIDARQSPGDLAGYEGFTAARAFMVKKNAVAGIHAIGLAVIHRDPVGIELGHPVGTARIEGRGFLLGDFLHQPVELTGAGLVDAGFLA